MLFQAFFLLITMLSAAPGLEEIKAKFNRAAQHPSDAEALFDQLSALKLKPDQRMYAWWGATETLLAKEAMLPTTKLSLLDKGMAKINASIKYFPDDLEIRLLRLTIQSQVPAFLGRSGNLQSDKEFMMRGLADKFKAGECKLIQEIAPQLKFTGVLNKEESTLLNHWSHHCKK